MRPFWRYAEASALGSWRPPPPKRPFQYSIKIQLIRLLQALAPNSEGPGQRALGLKLSTPRAWAAAESESSPPVHIDFRSDTARHKLFESIRMTLQCRPVSNFCSGSTHMPRGSHGHGAQASETSSRPDCRPKSKSDSDLVSRGILLSCGSRACAAVLPVGFTKLAVRH